jgi:flagellar biosynthesis chaperone FliJ
MTMNAMTETDDGSGPDEKRITVGETADGEPYELPLEPLLTGRTFITGKTGSGKSNTGSVLAEEILERGLPLLVVDVDGEYWGLKEEYEILHVGATDECDLQVGPEHASKLAELALEQHVPIILDVSGYLDVDDADALVRETARELFAREQDLLQPFLMLVEEIHEYVPEGGGLDETGQMLIRVAKRGRKRGLGIGGMSQRPADVKKDFITQCDWLVWHRLTWSNDTAVVRDVVDAETADVVEDLADGEAFVQADWSDVDVERVQFRRKRTFDAGATPGLDDVERPELKSIDEDLVDELEEISDRAQQRQDRIEQLEQRLEERDERIQELEEDLEDARDLQRLGEAFVDAAENRGGSAVADVDRELLEEKNETISELREDVDELEEHLADVQEERDELAAEVERLRGIEERIEEAERIEDLLERARDVLGVDVSTSTTADAGDEELRDQLEDAQAEIEQLRSQREELKQRLEEQSGVTVPTDYEDFVDDETVREQIRAAKQSTASAQYVKAVVATILEAGGPVTKAEVMEYPDANDKTHVSRAAKQLEKRRVLQIDESGEATTFDFNINAIAEVKEQSRRLAKRQELMEDL